MSFFDDDPFDEIVREFFGGSRLPRRKKESFIQGENEERIIDVLDDKDCAYVIFELPGFEEKDVSIQIKGRTIEVNIKKRNVEEIKEYLAQKLAAGMHYTRILPEFINQKNFEYTLKNGILEIKFDKK